MEVKIDSIGGISQLSYMPVSDVSFFVKRQHEVLIKTASDWYDIPCDLKQVAINVSPSTEDAGELYEHSAQLNISSNQVDDNLHLLIESNYFRYGILKYKLMDGTEKIIGSKDFPLVFTYQDAAPGVASEFIGYSFSFISKLPHKQLVAKFLSVL